MASYKSNTSRKVVDAEPIDVVTSESIVTYPSGPRAVGANWIDKNKPRVNGYFVKHKNGRVSYMDAKSFTQSYNAIQQA